MKNRKLEILQIEIVLYEDNGNYGWLRLRLTTENCSNTEISVIERSRNDKKK